MTIQKLISFCKKYKYILFLALIVLLLLFLLNKRSLLEGFASTGEYDYLAPLPTGNNISIHKINQFIQKFNKQCFEINNLCQPFYIDPSDNYLIKSTLEKEVDDKTVKFYIDNGYWPWGRHLVEYTRELLDQTPDVKISVMNLQKIFTARGMYYYIAPSDATLSPQPTAYKVYMGTIAPPTDTQSPNENIYSEFVDLCKRVVSLEGFETIGTYEYLSPPPPGNKIRNATYNEFSKVLTDIQCKDNIAKGQTCSPFVPNKSDFEKNVTDSEMQYYITNKKWPWGSYLIKEITKKINNDKARILKEYGEIKDPMLKLKTSKNIELLRQEMMFNTRNAYNFLLLNPMPPALSTIDKNSLGYKIYMGTARPPGSNY